MNTDSIVYQARLHWIIFAWPVIAFAIVVAIGVYFEPVRQPSMLLGVLLLLWVIATYGRYHFCSLTIIENQLILKNGFLTRQTMNIPLNKIESIDIRQTLVGTVLGYGNLEIVGTGGSRGLMTYVSKPLTCRRYIEQMMHG